MWCDDVVCYVVACVVFMLRVVDVVASVVDVVAFCGLFVFGVVVAIVVVFLVVELCCGVRCVFAVLVVIVWDAGGVVVVV